jgi:branched-chain amino acid transport system substrate-binding protein
MFKNKKLLSIVLAIFMLFSVNFFTNCSKKEKEENVIKIGCNLPLTGDFATYGESVKNGVDMFLRELLENNKDIKIPIEFYWQDNKGEAKNAVSILQKQLLESIDIFVTGVKPQTMAIIDRISSKKVPHFVWIFDAYVCKEYNNTFRTWVSYKYEPEYYLKYIEKNKPDKIAILYVNLPHSEQEFKEIVIPKIKKSGINNILIEAYPWTKKDYKDIAVKVKTYKPDLIIVNGFKSTIIGLVKALRNYNLINNGNTIVTYDMLDAAEELSKETVESIRVITPYFSIEKDKPEIIKWKSTFKKIYNRKARYSDAYAYDMAKIIYEVSKRIEYPVTKEKLSEEILKTKFDSITGSIKFDKDGDLIIELKIGVFRNGRLVLDEQFYKE